MSDNNMPEGTPETPKSATDLAIEKLTAKIEAMEKAHAEQVKALEDANKSLWAAAHPAPAQVTEPNPAPSAEFDFDKASDAFYNTLGKMKE